MSAYHAKNEAEARIGASNGSSTPITGFGWLRLIVRILTLVLLIIALVPLHYLYRIFSQSSPIPMYFLRFSARVVGARVRVIGHPRRRDVFFISNHVSWIDILAVAGASGTAFVAKAELKSVPLIGWLASLNRTVFVKRENRMGVTEQIKELREALHDNWSVTVFPEGTVTDGHSLLPFKTSMLRVLEPPPPNVKVQPIMIHYGDIAEWIGWVGEETGLNNAKRILARKGTFVLELHFLKPFNPAELGGRKAIAAKARQNIERALVSAIGGPLREFKFSVDPVRYEPETRSN